MNENSSTDRENRRLHARVENLQEQLQNLADDNRGLHRQMAAVIDHLSDTTTCRDTAGPALELPPPTPAEPLIKRAIRKALRMAAGAIRTLRRASDPGADMVRVLATVADSSPPKTLPILGEDLLIDLDQSLDPIFFSKDDLRWLFAVEGIDAAWIRKPGTETEILVARPDLFDTLRTSGKAGLVQAAEDLKRPVVAKHLPCLSLGNDQESLLHPVTMPDGSIIWRNAFYSVGLPKGIRRAELKFNISETLPLSIDPVTLLVLLSEPPVEGLEHSLTSGIEAIEDASRLIISLAPWTEIGQQRLRALSSDEKPVLEFGSFLHPATWDIALRSIFQSASPTTLWAIGKGSDLSPHVKQALAIVPKVRIVQEAIGSENDLLAADSTIVRTESLRNQLEGTPGVGALHLARSPFGHRASSSSPKVRQTLGVPADATLVVVAGDLTASGRAEDTAAVARSLAHREDIWFRVVGRGPLAPTVDDLGRLFGLQRFAVSDPDHGLDDIVAAADVICCPGRNEILPPSAAIAIASGVPVAAPSTGEAAEIAELHPEGIHLAGSAGDTDALAKAVLEAADSGLSASTLSETEILERAEKTKRTYREALTGH